MKIWKDCKKCKKTYEVIMEEQKNLPPPLPGKSKKQEERDSLLEEFELMLNGLDDLSLDDDDDDDIYNYKGFDFDDDDTF